MGTPAKKPKRKPERAWTSDDVDRVKGHLLPLFCSTTWMDDVVSAAEKLRLAPQVGHLPGELLKLGLYPPADPPAKAADRRPSLMRQCSRCGRRWYPANYMSTASTILKRRNTHGRVDRIVTARRLICQHCREVAKLEPHQRNQDWMHGRHVYTTGVGIRRRHSGDRAPPGQYL